MRFENAFDVAAPVEEVWDALLDVRRVAPCMPGAEVIEQTAEDAYKVGLKVKLGPISMTYRANVEITSRDAAAREATMRAKAKETRGQGTADATVQMSLAGAATGDGTHATIATELALSGKAAAMGQGVVADVSERLVQEFASNLAVMLSGEPAPGAETPPAESSPGEPARPATPPGAGALPIGKVIGGVIAGRLSNPRALAIAAGVLAVACVRVGYVLGRRRGRASAATSRRPRVRPARRP
jgi:carbon monoxide dehydrogenase subunit G